LEDDRVLKMQFIGANRRAVLELPCRDWNGNQCYAALLTKHNTFKIILAAVRHVCMMVWSFHAEGQQSFSI